MSNILTDVSKTHSLYWLLVQRSHVLLLRHRQLVVFDHYEIWFQIRLTLKEQFRCNPLVLQAQSAIILCVPTFS